METFPLSNLKARCKVSHIATVEIEFKDLDCLAKACTKCGVELRMGQKQFKWFAGKVSECDAAISVPQNTVAYEIGVHIEGGKIRLSYDPWNKGNGMQNHIAFEDDIKGIGKLQQAYAVEVARKQAKRQGFSVREQVQADGRIKLTLAR